MWLGENHYLSKAGESEAIVHRQCKNKKKIYENVTNEISSVFDVCQTLATVDEWHDIIASCYNGDRPMVALFTT